MPLKSKQVLFEAWLMITQSDFQQGLTFFNERITNVNDMRMAIIRSKGPVAQFFFNQAQRENYAMLKTPLGILSFSLYLARLTSNLILLMNSNQQLQLKKIYWQIANDVLWATLNFLEFFIFTFSVSVRAGKVGLGLEILGLSIDILSLLIKNHQILVSTHESKKGFEGALQGQKLFFTKTNLLRALLQMSLIIALFSLLITSMISGTGFVMALYFLSISAFFIKSLQVIDNKNQQLKIIKIYNRPKEELKVGEVGLAMEQNQLVQEGMIRYFLLPIGLYFSLMLTPPIFIITLSLLSVACMIMLNQPSMSHQWVMGK